MRSGKKIPRYQGRSLERSVIRLLMCCVISGLRGASGDEKEPLGCPIDRQCRSLLRAFRVSPLWGKMSNARTEANQGRLWSEGVSVSRVEIFSRREPKPDWGLEGRTERRKRATYPKGTISKRRQIGRISPTDFLLRRSCGGRFRQRVNEVKNEADSGADDKFRSLSPAICTRSNPSSGYEYE